jgi:hypothetical protein
MPRHSIISLPSRIKTDAKYQPSRKEYWNGSSFVMLPEAGHIPGHPVPHLHVGDVGALGDHGLVVLKVSVELVGEFLHQVDCDSFDVRRSNVAHVTSGKLLWY